MAPAEGSHGNPCSFQLERPTQRQSPAPAGTALSHRNHRYQSMRGLGSIRRTRMAIRFLATWGWNIRRPPEERRNWASLRGACWLQLRPPCRNASIHPSSGRPHHHSEQYRRPPSSACIGHLPRWDMSDVSPGADMPAAGARPAAPVKVGRGLPASPVAVDERAYRD